MREPISPNQLSEDLADFVKYMMLYFSEYAES